MSWILLWKLVVVLTLAAFSALVALVLIGGVGNIAQMLKDLRQPDDVA
ncbi:MAG: hypothetical protein QHJ34_12325 [bacterium]|jgi:hypothetical protein|nr:hypothetical protein [candidate division KSB1 bacterium]MDH7560997.1 hypothetical protein [bacterium]